MLQGLTGFSLSGFHIEISVKNKRDSDYSESKGLALAAKLPILIGMSRSLSDLGRIGCKMIWPVHPPKGLLRAHPKGTSFGAHPKGTSFGAYFLNLLAKRTTIDQEIGTACP